MVNYQPPPQVHPYPDYSPRFWSGMTLRTWLGLLARNRFAIHPLRWTMAAGVTAFSTFSTVFSAAQRALYGRQIAATELAGKPLFILGHWRSGTTYLHELLSLDERFTTPTTYQVYSAGHFLLTEQVARKLFWWVVPSKRPMDNMDVGFDSPQEDEWALATLGAPSPYLRVAFPKSPPPFENYLDMEGLSDRELDAWEKQFRYFLQAVTLRHNKRLILKSPHHTGRIHVLRKIFPGSRFVHLVRNPYSLVPSTVRMWQSFDWTQGMQRSRGEHLADYVLETGRRMYASFERHRGQCGPDELCEVRYEDLVADPAGQLERIYRMLGLGDFESVRSKVAEFVRAKQNYKTNRNELPEELRQAINERWSAYRERYGYAD